MPGACGFYKKKMINPPFIVCIAGLLLWFLAGHSKNETFGTRPFVYDQNTWLGEVGRIMFAIGLAITLLAWGLGSKPLSISF